MNGLKSETNRIELSGEAECNILHQMPQRVREQGKSEGEPRAPVLDYGSQQDPKDLSHQGWICFDRFRCFGESDDLEEAMKYFLNSLALTPNGHPDMPHRLEGLGITYRDRFRRLGQLDDIEKSIEYYSRALALTPDGHQDMPRRLEGLGSVYHSRFQRLDELHDIEKSIEHYSRALALTPDNHQDMPHRLEGLGITYRDRFRRLNELDDIEKSIEHYYGALELTPDDHPDMPRRFEGLGSAYHDRFQRLDELEDLEKSIEHYSRALELTPDGHPDMPHRLEGLGITYRDQFRRLGELEDLEESIEYYSRALALTPKDHPDTPRRLEGLGSAYRDRFQRLDELDDIEKSIKYYSRALALTPGGHPDMPHRLEGLGVTHRDRFRRLNELDDIEKSIEHYSGALALTVDDHPDTPRRLEGLGSAYGDRFQYLNELEDLEKSIEHYSRALALTPDGHPDMPHRLEGLGVTYRDRFQHLGELEDLEKSIDYHSRALALTPEEHPDLLWRHYSLAMSYLNKFLRLGDPLYSNQSLNSFRSASQLPTGAPRNRFHFALQWATLASKFDSLHSIEAYKNTIDLLPQFIWLGATTTQRYQDLSATENLAINAANAAIRCSNYALALEWLEHARCVVWNQILMLRSPLDHLHSSHPNIATRLQAVTNQLDHVDSETQTVQTTPSGSITPEQAGQQRRRLAQEYQNLLAQARQLPGFEDFLQPIKASGLIRAAQNGPIVVINSHETCCDALLILPGYSNIGHLHLPNFSNRKAQRARFEMEKSLRPKRLKERGVKLMWEPLYTDRIGNVLETLWYNVVHPVLDFLGYKNNVSMDSLPHITWCPTGALSFLPLHAAGDYNKPHSSVFHYVISSYTPTLTALIVTSPSSISCDRRILAIGQENTPGHAPLPGTAKELASVEAHTQDRAQYSQLTDHQATKAAVLDAMEQHDWVHLACHAHQNIKNPTKSGFHLHDGTLDLAAINQRSFKNKGLAFLSACQTATGDEKLPDEAVHLASGMLMAGYPSVIATMWSVADDDAPLVADKVYAELMKEGNVGNGGAGKALHYAVAALREKVGEKEFGRWVPYIHIGS
ncbi:unnamed protein product [Rhizoctonia solani]|uniref:CHAT domain-containing protein n=1 Tax=Rhizoctonia solani TaxID=456999 RepID=A0A8H3BQN9_9AGAM|nr:unnamed protein product [Rhizoctonia solani]